VSTRVSVLRIVVLRILMLRVVVLRDVLAVRPAFGRASVLAGPVFVSPVAALLGRAAAASPFSFARARHGVGL
jgi:hypothetical protein